MRQHLRTLSLILPLALLPFTFMTVFAQNAVPGDPLYGYKRGLEGVILASASVHPTTRAMFQSNLADRRFSEVEKVILAKQDTSGLSEFIFTVAKAAEQIDEVSDVQTKAELQQNFTTSLQTYQQKIQEIRTVYFRETIVQERVIVEEREAVREVEVAGQPPPPPPPTNTPVPVPTSRPGERSVPTNTSVPPPPTNTSTPPPTVPITIPTATPTPTTAPTGPTSPGSDLNDAEKYLKCLQDNPGHPERCSIPPALQRRERRGQEAEERGERQAPAKKEDEESREHKEKNEEREDKKKVRGISVENPRESSGTIIEILNWLTTPSIRTRIEGITP